MKEFILRRPWVAVLIAGLAGATIIAMIWAATAALSSQNVGAPPDEPAGPQPSESVGPDTTQTPSPTLPAPSDTPDNCPDGTVSVTSAEELAEALAIAMPGDAIILEPGTYVGNFVTTASGTADEPITLCGTAESVLDGDDVKNGYVLHLDGAQYWRLIGFTVTNGQKGVMADGTVGSVIHGLTVQLIGDEAIHLRRESSDNTVSANTISDTGLRKVKFGEGIYIGSAKSNWCELSDCEPDRSDRNIIQDNTISRTTAESIDVKEGTSDGIIRNNTFDGSTITGADSWVDVKGNGYLIVGNTGVNSPLDGFQTHQILDGWGTNNTFRDNRAQVNGPGFGYSLTPVEGNVVECSNTASQAGEGDMNVSCSR